MLALRWEKLIVLTAFQYFSSYSENCTQSSSIILYSGSYRVGYLLQKEVPRKCIGEKRLQYVPNWVPLLSCHDSLLVIPVAIFIFISIRNLSLRSKSLYSRDHDQNLCPTSPPILMLLLVADTTFE